MILVGWLLFRGSFKNCNLTMPSASSLPYPAIQPLHSTFSIQGKVSSAKSGQSHGIHSIRIHREFMRLGLFSWNTFHEKSPSLMNVFKIPVKTLISLSLSLNYIFILSNYNFWYQEALSSILIYVHSMNYNGRAIFFAELVTQRRLNSLLFSVS